MASLLLFRSSAALSLLTSVGHIRAGYAQGFYKAWDKTPPAARHAATTSWDSMNVLLYITALLNWRWSKTGGPTTVEEKAMFALLMMHGFFEGWRFFRIGVYPPLIFCWLVPMTSLTAWLL
ncbi:hypothetical protein F5Y15DRAFT_282020 [Xylariaceae sp. FL0016]|nr:hypothetical protein F5Y15DRAFT_282020 [Xylariaceae sp. FL0016]